MPTMVTRLDFASPRRARHDPDPPLHLPPSGLAVASASCRGLVVISAAGDVDLATVAVLRDTLHTALRAASHIVLDLGRVTYFDQAGFRVCLACWRSCRRHRRVLALTNPAPVVRKVVKILDVDRLLPLFASVGEASAALLERSR